MPARCHIVRRSQRTIGRELAAIHAPVLSRPLEELLQEENETQVRIGSRQLVRKSTAYILLGLASVALLVWLLWRSMTVIDNPAEADVGNLVAVASRADGRISELLVREGQPVQQGQLLFMLSNSDLEEAVSVCRAELSAARTRSASLEEQLHEEERRTGFHRKVTEKPREQEVADLQRAEARLDFARVERNRVEELHAQGLAPTADLDLALRREGVLAEEIRALREQLEIAELNVAGVGEGRFVAGQEIEGRIIELRERLRVARDEVSEAERRMDAAISRLQETRVQAPVDGIVGTIYHRPGEVLRPRDVVLSIEVDDRAMGASEVSSPEWPEPEPRARAGGRILAATPAEPSSTPSASGAAARSPGAPESGAFEVQLAAMRNEVYAHELEGEATRLISDLPGSLRVEVHETTLASGVLYRVVVRPVADRAAGVALCETLQNRGLECFVRGVGP